MAAPTGTCYPQVAGTSNFTRDISFTYAYFLKREGQNRKVDQCANTDTGWKTTAIIGTVEGGRDTFTFPLQFALNPAYVPGVSDPRTMYNCTNINDYTTLFETFMLNLEFKATTAAAADCQDGATSDSKCGETNDCPPVTQKKYIYRQRNTTVAGIRLMQSNTPGCV